jgi:hypothetical protein
MSKSDGVFNRKEKIPGLRKRRAAAPPPRRCFFPKSKPTATQRNHLALEDFSAAAAGSCKVAQCAKKRRH